MWAIIGPPAKRHLNGVSQAGWRWHNIESWIGCFVLLPGIRTSIAKKHYIFVIFHGRGSGPPAPPPLWIRTCPLSEKDDSKITKDTKYCITKQLQNTNPQNIRSDNKRMCSSRNQRGVACADPEGVGNRESDPTLENHKFYGFLYKIA